MNGRTVPAALRWAGYAAVAILFAIACAYLSNWQFTRNADRSEQLALIAANYDADPVPLAEVIPSGADLDAGDQWRPVMLQGRYLDEQTLLVRNRPHGGTSAFEVLVPFRLDDGRVLLVDRGWVPPGEEQPDPDVIPAPPTGTSTVVVRLRPSEPLPDSGRSAPEGQVPTIHLPLIADTIASGAALETSAYGLMVTEDPASQATPAAIDPPSDDPGPHLSYAIQWILFAIMGFVFIGYIIRTELRHRREDLQDRPGRRSRDAVDEDEWAERVGR